MKKKKEKRQQGAVWETQGEGGGSGGGQLGLPSFQGDDAVGGDTHGMLWGGQRSRTRVPMLTHSCPGGCMLSCECSRGSPGWPCTAKICPDLPWVTSVGLQPCRGTVRQPSRALKSLPSWPGHRQHTLTHSRPQADPCSLPVPIPESPPSTSSRAEESCPASGCPHARRVLSSSPLLS